MAIGTAQDAIGEVGDSLTRIAYTGDWTTINSDAAAINATPEMMNPLSANDSTNFWRKIPRGCGSVVIRARIIAAGTTAVTANTPRIRLYAGYGALVSDVPEKFLRIDATGPGVTGQVLTFPASPTTSNCFNDVTNFYSQPVSLAGSDLCGGSYLTCMIETAAAGTLGGAMFVEALFRP